MIRQGPSADTRWCPRRFGCPRRYSRHKPTNFRRLQNRCRSSDLVEHNHRRYSPILHSMVRLYVATHVRHSSICQADQVPVYTVTRKSLLPSPPTQRPCGEWNLLTRAAPFRRLHMANHYTLPCKAVYYVHVGFTTHSSFMIMCFEVDKVKVGFYPDSYLAVDVHTVHAHEYE